MGRGKAQRSLDLIQAAKEILDEIAPASVRAVCYVLFTRGLIASMGTAETKRVSAQLVWAREQGHIDWDDIVDESRPSERPATWRDLAEYADIVERGYRRDRWDEQPEQVLVVSEKATVSGTLRPVLQTYGVEYRPVHGWSSASVVHEIAADSQGFDRPLRILYCGDHDPSGMYMSVADLPGRLARYGGNVRLERIALVTGRDTTTGLPSFPVESKTTDTRYRWYRERYGARCWELDALPPPQLRARVEAAIRALIDWPAWQRAERVEQAERRSVREVVRAWRGRGSA